MDNSEQEESSGFSICSLIGSTLGVLPWFVWQAIKRVLIGILLLLYDDGIKKRIFMPVYKQHKACKGMCWDI